MTERKPFIATGLRHMYADYTLATYDYWIALCKGDKDAMAEAVNRETYADEYGSLRCWLDEVADADDAYMAVLRANDPAAWENLVRFDMEGDASNFPDEFGAYEKAKQTLFATMIALNPEHKPSDAEMLTIEERIDEMAQAIMAGPRDKQPINDHNDGSGYYYTLRRARGLWGFQIHQDDNAVIDRSPLAYLSTDDANAAAKAAIRDYRSAS